MLEQSQQSQQPQQLLQSPTLEGILNQLPDYAKDVKLNVKSVLTPEGAPDLSVAQIYGIALAAVYVTQNAKLITAFTQESQDKLNANEFTAVKAAAGLMAMNNMYFNCVHLVEDAEIKAMRPNLRMNFMANPGVARLDFALYSLAVSILNGCSYCINAHIGHAVEQGLSKVGIHSAMRIAAIMNSLAQVIAIEQ